MEPWFKAAKNNDVAYIKQHYRQMNGTRTTNGGYTALMIAARYGCREVVTLLKDYETKIHCDTHWTALMFACDCGYQPIVRELAPYEAGFHDHRGFTGLMRAAIHGFTAIVKELLPYDGELNATLKEAITDFPKGSNALTMAMMTGHKDVLFMLLPKEAPNTTPELIQECIQTHELSEAQAECVSLTKMYVEQYATVASDAFKEMHPWFHAAATNNTAYILEHLNECATICNPDDSNRCALFYAILHGAQDVANVLFDLEKDCIDAENNRFTAYMKNTLFSNIVVGSSPCRAVSATAVTDVPGEASAEVNIPLNKASPVVAEPKCLASTATFLKATPRLTVPNSKPIPMRAVTTRTTHQETRAPKNKEPKKAGAISPSAVRSRSIERHTKAKEHTPTHTPARTPNRQPQSTISTRSFSTSSFVSSRVGPVLAKNTKPRRSFSSTIPGVPHAGRTSSGALAKANLPTIAQAVEQSTTAAVAAIASSISQAPEIQSISLFDTCHTISEHTEESTHLKDSSMPLVSMSGIADEQKLASPVSHNDECFKLLSKCNTCSIPQSSELTPGGSSRPSKYSLRGEGSIEGEKSLSALLNGITEKIEQLDNTAKQNTSQYTSLAAGFEKLTTLITGHNQQIENILKTQQALVDFMLQEKSLRERSESGCYSTATPASVPGLREPGFTLSMTIQNKPTEPVLSTDCNETVFVKQENASMSASACADLPQQISVLSPNESFLCDQAKFITKSAAPAAISTIFMGPAPQSIVGDTLLNSDLTSGKKAAEQQTDDDQSPGQGAGLFTLLVILFMGIHTYLNGSNIRSKFASINDALQIFQSRLFSNYSLIMFLTLGLTIVTITTLSTISSIQSMNAATVIQT